MLRLQRRDGSYETVRLDIADGPPWNLTLHLQDAVREIQGRDLFDALMNLRRDLERAGVRVLCAGARCNVFPSGMSRSMSAGRKAYRLIMGHPAAGRDLVDIFEPADEQDLCTVEEQEAFFAAWLRSIGD